MIVRESPKAGVRREPQNWPPKSPHEALLSSPSGRRKYQQQRERNSVSPSPMKRRPMSRSLPTLGGEDEDDDDDDDEDEETVQLRLQAINAKLKLKKLQKARQAAENAENDGARASSRPGTAASLRKVELPRPQSVVEVPVSPIRNRRVAEEPKSPARVLLGIDKGLRAQDVSLKRASSFHSRTARGGPGSLARAYSTREVEAPREKSFSERIAESRAKVKEKEEKQLRIEKSRSRGFGLNNIEGLRDGASSRADSSLSSGTRTSSQDVPSARSLDRSRSVADFRNTPTLRPGSNLSSRTESFRGPSAASQASSTALRNATTSTKYSEIAGRDDSSEAASFESFSGLHLKTRDMQHTTLTRTLEGKTILTIPQLLKDVKAPNWDPPDMENDFVVLGVIASKSTPLTPKNARREQQAGSKDADTNQTGKFMVIRLTDLKWELDLFLFDTGFSQFWKLSEGTLVAILNPDIMPPRNKDTGKFSLKLSSSDDTVLEIGIARDLDFCHANRKDGKACEQWIDGRKTEFCDFHIELQVERSKRGRMEVNTMTGFGKGPRGGGKHGMFGGGRGRGGGGGQDEMRREGKFHDRLLHETVYIAPGAGNAARLLDHDEQSWERGGSRAEKHQKRLAEKEKERDLAQRLGELGSGAGGDYMKVKGSDAQNLPARGDFRTAETAAAREKRLFAMDDPLGLTGKKAEDVSLAPVKRKRLVSGKTEAFSAPVGWGGAFKPGLPRSPRKESSMSSRGREPSPVKKKARLLLPEKGIREPGRESIGGLDVGLLAAMDEDDDDDLEVI
ncbi:hypothetical protein K505DRAFT_249469 [Melanomma pulvis-pyrius CBS 109.77]|uniref:Uncharacterized protein n=1 Tax=Melanomma pulvis-pyrius CBS 109.77 TaxID=1314802 RepID=A0A6A6X4X3_9PLEO|nr:hypothetical protein K505DRAFT_249469 [Melanomma pulvis-pyrius CBS 109.77]